MLLHHPELLGERGLQLLHLVLHELFLFGNPGLQLLLGHVLRLLTRLPFVGGKLGLLTRQTIVRATMARWPVLDDRRLICSGHVGRGAFGIFIRLLTGLRRAFRAAKRLL